ncbi:MAG: 5-formyltetrahydrofolate cyclo-ligase [Cyclobacteriaceae bacterium]|jgi:5-formyltetrahydrofolate cyclo-ligase|nr:5-formyltetrahydrofolate cyclo-ligase [Cyclobacteriaceae bacterium]
MTKAEARKTYLARRLALPFAQREVLNLQLYHLFFVQPFLHIIKTLHVYLPLQEKGEPDTWQIIDKLRREHGHIRLVVPKVNTAGHLEHYFFEGLHQLHKNKWNIWEPVQGVPAAPEKLDAVLVPLLAYDEQGNRAGYGKGFYDRFLAQCRPDCVKIGLSFFGPCPLLDDVEPTDVRINQVLTPEGMVVF